MKKIISYLLISICCVGLTGCGSFPEMTASEQKLIAEYAAGILLQHSEKADNRLTEVDETAVLEEVEPEETKEEPPVEEPKEEMDNNDIPVIDNTRNDMPQENVVSLPLNQIIELDNVSIQSNGYEICDTYSEGGGGYFTLDASEECKLVVLKYTLANQTQETVEINMINTAAKYKVALDGSGYKYALSTMLLDDMSTYVGTIQAGESVDVVLISEWKEAEVSNITNLTLYIENGAMVGTYPVE